MVLGLGRACRLGRSKALEPVVGQRTVSGGEGFHGTNGTEINLAKSILTVLEGSQGIRIVIRVGMSVKITE